MLISNSQKDFSKLVFWEKNIYTHIYSLKENSVMGINTRMSELENSVLRDLS